MRPYEMTFQFEFSIKMTVKAACQPCLFTACAFVCINAQWEKTCQKKTSILYWI